MLRGVTDLAAFSLAENRRFMQVVFELQQIPGGIFKKERAVFDPGAGKADAGLLIEGQSFLLGLFQELLPRTSRQEDQAEMAGIDALL